MIAASLPMTIEAAIKFMTCMSKFLLIFKYAPKFFNEPLKISIKTAKIIDLPVVGTRKDSDA